MSATRTFVASRAVAATTLIVLAACNSDRLATGPDGGAELNVTASPIDAQQGPPFMPGEILLTVQEGERPEAVAADFGLTIASRGYANRFVVLRGAIGNEQGVAARMKADRRVRIAEPNWLRRADADSRLWGFYNPGGLTFKYKSGASKGQPVTTYASKADADVDNTDNFAAAATGTVVIGSIDSGVEFSHPEFSSDMLIKGTDWYDNDADASDTDSHGTHTSGTMAGRTVGVAGVAGAFGKVKLHVQRVCGALGCPSAAIASAIRAAADVQDMVAMNLSLGGSVLSATEADAITYAVVTKNVLVIASAGNGNTNTVSCPACDERAISVAALNWMDGRAYYSSWGQGLDISAPGGETYSNTTSEGGIYSAVRGGGYAFYQGTSMAAPMVTGVAGITALLNPTIRGASLRQRLISTADDLGDTGYDEIFGAGRVNAYRAAMNTNEPTPLAAVFSASCSGTTCTFDASASTGVSSRAWTVAGVGAGSAVTWSRTFNAAGAYPVVLTVTGSTGGTASATRTVNCTVSKGRLRCSVG